MKKLIVLAFSLVFAGSAFAQADLDLSQYQKLTGAAEDGVQGMTDGLHAGLNSLEWTDGSGPDVFRLGISLYTGLGTIPAEPAIGLKDDAYFPSFGGQVNLGTMGAEVYFRMFPKIDASGVEYGTWGVGAKYDITDFIPVTGFPSTSAYVSYSSFAFSVTDSRTVDGEYEVAPGLTYPYSVPVDSKAEINASSFNIGAITSYDLVIVRVFGRVALEMASSEVKWNTVIPDGTINVQTQTANTKPFEGGNDFGNSGLRLGAGLSLIGIKAEVGYRSGLYAGLGYGITF